MIALLTCEVSEERPSGKNGPGEKQAVQVWYESCVVRETDVSLRKTSLKPYIPAPLTMDISPSQGTGVFIVGAKRTPIGAMGGQLAGLSAAELGGIAIAAALKESKFPSDAVQACCMGHVLSAGAGQAPARQAATHGGLGKHAITSSVNKVCAAGMAALIHGCMEIQLCVHEAVMVGGMESMSQCPFYVKDARFGARLGNRVLEDGLVHDGLMEPGDNSCHMGMHAELCASTHNFSRAQQDTYAAESYRRGIAARDGGLFTWEIAGTPLPSRSGEGVVMTADEELARTSVSSLSGQSPAFLKKPPGAGTVTAGNASPLSDGAAALLLVTRAAASSCNAELLAEILAYGSAEIAPEHFTTAPTQALKIAVSGAGLQMKDIDLFELNEAFAVVALANMNLLELVPEKVNVFGGAVALGHPLGCSGARIVVTLINALRRRGGGIGAAAVCNGGGGSSAVVIRVFKPSC